MEEEVAHHRGSRLPTTYDNIRSVGFGMIRDSLLHVAFVCHHLFSLLLSYGGGQSSFSLAIVVSFTPQAESHFYERRVVWTLVTPCTKD